jgi:hypothetical protein
VLVRLGYPPVVIFKRQRTAYLTAMQRADSGDYGALGELIARAMYNNLNRFIVPNIAGPARCLATSSTDAGRSEPAPLPAEARTLAGCSDVTENNGQLIADSPAGVHDVGRHHVQMVDGV